MATTNLNLPTLASSDTASNFPATFNDAMNKLDAAAGKLTVKLKDESVTTTAYGNATTSLNPNSVILLSAYCTTDLQKVCSIYRANPNTFALHVINVAGDIVASTTFNVTLAYVER